ncbi:MULTISPECIES: hypothetical protein [unclassified Pseudomonas]|uniref:DUF6932 family protein n=1 Tax=unclassified Pseudomonas TaxID=196821 RepID=UPI002115BB3E|nr:MULTISPECIES: hypothetical protein [unclassified Pseudomonas]
MLIPQWNHQGIIPPIDENDPTALERAPYPVTVEQIVERFSTTIERCEILEGFLSHRAEMHRLGVVSGFQWLNGSFMEHVELLEGRAPNDMDVVTFADIRPEVEAALAPEDIKALTDNPWIKKTYKVDFYLLPLSEPAEFLVEMSAYWYSMWSHRRSQQWKGFLSVRLEPDHDDGARRLLENRKREVQNEQN